MIFFVDDILWNNFFVFQHQEKNQDLDVENTFFIFFPWLLCTIFFSALFAVRKR